MKILGLSLLIMLSFTIITFSNPSHLSFAQNSTSFVSSFEKLVKKANNLSQSYHNETGKFAKGQINNKTMIAITDNYLPKFQNLVKSQKLCSLLNNTKMLQIYIQRALNQSFKVIIISEIIYLQITLLRINCLQSYYLMHSTTKLRHLRSSRPLDPLQLYLD